MSYFGAEVIHPKTLLPAFENNIPIRIKNTFDPENPGTLINAESEPNGIKVINLITNIAVITVLGKGIIGVPGISGRTFSSASRVGANVLMISQSAAEQKISFTIKLEDAPKVIKELNNEFATEIKRKDISKIKENKGSILCCVGHGISENPHLLYQIFEVLKINNIPILMMALGASEKNLSMVLKQNDAKIALEHLHRRLMDVK